MKKRLILIFGIPVILVCIVVSVYNLSIYYKNKTTQRGVSSELRGYRDKELDIIVKEYGEPIQAEDHTVGNFPENQWYSDAVFDTYSKANDGDIIIKECSWKIKDDFIISAYCHFNNKEWTVLKAYLWKIMKK